MTLRLGKLVQHDDLEQAYAETYAASGQPAPADDRVTANDYCGRSDAELLEADRWARYYVESGVRRSAVVRLRAIHEEQQRRRTSADKNARQVRDHQAGTDPSA